MRTGLQRIIPVRTYSPIGAMNILTLLESRGIEVHRADTIRRDKHISRTGEWVQMVCPLCGTDHLWLGYNVEKHYFNCFNHGYSPVSVLLRAWFPRENIRLLLDSLDSPIPTKKKKAEYGGIYDPPKPLYSIMRVKRHREYIESRGLDPKEVNDKWGVRAIALDGEWRYQSRLFFPVCDERGFAVSWLTRTIDPNDEYRYLTAPKDREFAPIKDFLFGEQFCKYSEPIIVCEGVFDAMRIGRNAVATMGKKITDAQIARIAKYRERAILLDNEKDTQEQATKIAIEQLSAYPGITHKINLDAPDPATASDKEVAELLSFLHIA